MIQPVGREENGAKKEYMDCALSKRLSVEELTISSKFD
jgi:hypothetical protein